VGAVITRLRRSIGWGAAAATLAVAGGTWLLAAPVVAAADPIFEAATASSTFGEAITVEQRISLPTGVARLEAVVRAGGNARTFLAEIPNPGEGPQTLRYTFETPPGGLYPNTQVEIGFRVTLEDGTVFDGPTDRIRYEDTRFDWKTLEGDVVRVHWVEGDAAFGRRALEIGDRAVEDATRLLGVQESVPIDFFVYGDRDAFYDVLGPALQENVGGVALPEIRTLFANIGPGQVNDGWVGIVVPHELSHLVFDTATRNDYHEPLHWLNEGLADYLAQGYPSNARASVERAVRDGDLMPLHAIEFRFPSTAERFSLAYDESVSAIDYLIRTHGQGALVNLIRSYADGVSDDAAFTAALGVDVATFEAGWLRDLGATTPVPYGPRPAPFGSLPPGWSDAPIPTGPPVATPPPSSGPGSEDSGFTGPIIIAIVIALVLVLVGGLIVAGRSLSRGEPLLSSGLPPEPDAVPGAAPDAPLDPPGEADDRGPR
jgi:hypothetical protein